jgi:hypothetical protein
MALVSDIITNWRISLMRSGQQVNDQVSIALFNKARRVVANELIQSFGSSIFEDEVIMNLTAGKSVYALPLGSSTTSAVG